MFKKLALSIPAAALLLSSSMVMADANQERINIQLKADIPTSTFHVRPPASEDFTKEQVLQWDINKKELMAWKNRLEVLNTDKGIQAKLDVPPVLIDGAEKIALTVKVNGIDVSATQAIKVVDDADANSPHQVEFVITPVKPTDNYKPGLYTGSVSLIFEPTA